MRKIIGSILLLGGVVLMGLSFYITHRVEEGKGEVASGQRQVDQSKRLFSISPYIEGAGDLFTGSAEERLAMGRQKIAHYETMAYQFKVGGIVLIVVGAIVLLIRRKKS